MRLAIFVLVVVFTLLLPEEAVSFSLFDSPPADEDSNNIVQKLANKLKEAGKSFKQMVHEQAEKIKAPQDPWSDFKEEPNILEKGWGAIKDGFSSLKQKIKDFFG